ncbi:peptidaseCc14 [Colletotrichum sojae]|uniref:PeptidaseCc14 n=1 Tax=Colletotrichum sojae TaxID=2175907 RepID=A0A8H6MIE2_9PEZI|nr:peptidaseCc14 [Colletotrichum sojae]
MDQPEHLMTPWKQSGQWLSKDNDPNWKRAAIYALEGHSGLPDDILDEIADCVGSNDALLAKAASGALRYIPGLPKSTIQRIAPWLKPETYASRRRLFESRKNAKAHTRAEILKARTAALEALQDQENLVGDTSTCEVIAKCIIDEDINLRWSAVYALKGRPDLPRNAVNAVAQCAKNVKPDVTWGALDVLKDNPNLPEDAVNAISDCLQHKDRGLRKAAYDILKTQAKLTESAVLALLKFKNPDAQSVFQLIRHQDIRQKLLTAYTEDSFNALSQADRKIRPHFPSSGSERLTLGAFFLIHPPAAIIGTALVGFEHYHRRSTQTKDRLREVLTAESEPFSNALFRTARNYSLGP